MSAFSNDIAGRTSSRVAGDRGSLDQTGAGSRTPKKSPSAERTKPEVIGVSARAANTSRKSQEKRRGRCHKTAPTGRMRGKGDAERPVIRTIHFGRNRSGSPITRRRRQYPECPSRPLRLGWNARHGSTQARRWRGAGYAVAGRKPSLPSRCQASVPPIGPGRPRAADPCDRGDGLPTCGRLSQLSMIGRFTPAAGVPFVSSRADRRPWLRRWAISGHQDRNPRAPIPNFPTC
jgi:hypothetical protein